MKYLAAVMAMAVLLLSVGTSFGTVRSVTLKVKGMTCPSCPYIVKKVLAGVPGVSSVKVSFREKRVIVSFDDDIANLGLLTAATASVGFPSQVIE